MNWTNARGQQISTQLVLSAFSNLNSSNAQDCDAFFETYGRGNVFVLNSSLNIVSEPYERLIIYEHVLHELKAFDSIKYEQMHKGTPFYFISWLAFTIKDYEKAIFYMDAAIGEDIRKSAGTANPTSWQGSPASSFIILDPALLGPSARSITIDFTSKLSTEIQRFNGNIGVSLTLQLFKDRFVRQNISSNSYRSIISGLYVYILEFEERLSSMELRIDTNGSIEPFLVHLFKGCLIFESLLKDEYSPTQRGTLGNYLHNPLVRTDLNIARLPRYSQPVYERDSSGGYDLPRVINLLSSWRVESYIEKIIAITYGIRNTAGHDLTWPNVFNPTIYKELYESILDANLWFIWKKKV